MYINCYRNSIKYYIMKPSTFSIVNKTSSSNNPAKIITFTG